MERAPITREYRIISEPRGVAYENLLAFCSEVGAWCSLVDLSPKVKSSKAFLAKAKDYAIGVDQVANWPGGKASKGTVALWRYALSVGFVSLLVDSTPGLFGWRSPKLPEDLAVYRRNGSVLLGSIAHEHIGWMHLSEDEVHARLLGLVELHEEGS